jgi:hypothetical protein
MAQTLKGGLTMKIKAFAYGFEEETVLNFIEWWIKSENFSKDVKIGDKVNGGSRAIRSVDHTIRIDQSRQFELLIEKDAIMSDGSRKKLKKGELYLNKGLLTNGFKESVRHVKRWLEEVEYCDPYLMDPEKAEAESQKFDMIGTGLFIETTDNYGQKLLIVANVVGIPK